MIIDTESPEGQALVALAKLGALMLDADRYYMPDECYDLAIDLKLLEFNGVQYVKTTSAKLPEGL